MDRLLKATKSARHLTVGNGDSDQSDNQETCSSSQGEVNESIEAIIEDKLLWAELQRELRSSQVLTNACLQEAIQRFIEKKEKQLKRIKRKKQMPFRRMCSDSVIGRRFSPNHERRLSQEEKEKNNRSSSLDNTSGVDATIAEDDHSGDGHDHAEDSEKNDTFALAASIYPMKELPAFQMLNIAALKEIMLRSSSKDVELQKEAEAAAAAKKENLVEFRERIHRRLSMEKLDEKMATMKLALAPETLSEGISTYDSDDDSDHGNKGEWSSEYERSLYMKSLLAVAEFMPQESSSSFSSYSGSSQASSRWKSEDDDDEHGNINKEKASEETINKEADDEEDLICDFPSQPRKTRRKTFQQDHAFAA